MMRSDSGSPGRGASLARNSDSLLSDASMREGLQAYLSEPPDDRLISAIRSYTELLLRWNEKVSLTSLRTAEEILKMHFGESFFGARLISDKFGRLADIGSGAGFPGLALKILRPKLSTTLIESNAKKAAFLGEVVRKLGLGDVEVFRGRSGDYPSEQQVDLVSARAVGRFPELLVWARRHLTPGGCVVLWVSADGLDAVQAVDGWIWSEPLLVPNTRQRFVASGRLLP
jgi:16S rRNA (guanine527-N7)-methyltransferase